MHIQFIFYFLSAVQSIAALSAMPQLLGLSRVVTTIGGSIRHGLAGANRRHSGRGHRRRHRGVEPIPEVLGDADMIVLLGIPSVSSRPRTRRLHLSRALMNVYRWPSSTCVNFGASSARAKGGMQASARSGGAVACYQRPSLTARQRM